MTSMSFRFLAASLLLVCFRGVPGLASELPPSALAAIQILSLDDCLRMAKENNRRRPASRMSSRP
jgi:hypothetical protein